MTTGATQFRVPDVGPPGGPAGRGPRHWWYVVGVLATAALVALAVVLLVADDTDTVTPAAPSAGPTVGPTTEPTTGPTTGPTPGPTTGPSAPGGVDRSTAIWPMAGAAGYDDPVQAARAFATDFLGFEEPVAGAFRQGDTRSGEVPVRPMTTGPETAVLVRQLSGEDTWSVLAATTEAIEVGAPTAGALVSSPVTVRGSAHTFEGNVVVELREDGRRSPIGRTVVTGGGDQMRPFSGTLTFATPTRAYGALVFLVFSAKDGSLWQAAALRVQLGKGGTLAPAACKVPAGGAPGPGEMAVTVYYTCDPENEGVPGPEPVKRAVPSSPGVLRASLTALLAGPTQAERDAGMTSFFSSATAGMVRNVALRAGHAVIDFGDLPSVIPNASSSAGSALLLSEVDATVFQFATVASAEYRIAGDCTAFNEWLQLGGCAPRTR